MKRILKGKLNILLVILAVAIIAPPIRVYATSDVNEANTDTLGAQEQGTEAAVGPASDEFYEYEMALSPLPEDEEVEPYYPYYSLMMLGEEDENALPAKYDNRANMPGVRDQNPYGNCWAFASLASFESSMIRRGLVDTTIDLSELHTTYYASHTGLDALGNTLNDSISPNDNYLSVGGNRSMSIIELSNWKGVTNESLYPIYKDSDKLNEVIKTLTPTAAYSEDRYYLKRAYTLPMSQTEDVKRLIIEYGCVYSECYFTQYSPYYNSKNAAYYTDETKTRNHAVSIVGWDDTYSRDNFTRTPSSDGAWIVRNSWGSGFGDNGYFYVSYEDKNMCGTGGGTAAAFEGSPLDPKLNNYYNSGGGLYAYSYPVYGAGECFTAKGNKGGTETIDSVGIFLNSASVPYSVSVYVDPVRDENGDIKISLSEPVVTEEGITTYAGYYMHDFEEKVTVNEGQEFLVAFSFYKTSESGSYQRVYVKYDESYSDNHFSTVNNTAKNESFFAFYMNSQPTFFDAESKNDFKGKTPRINVITSDGSEKNPTINVTEANLSLSGIIGLNMYADIPAEYINSGAYAVINGKTDEKILLNKDVFSNPSDGNGNNDNNGTVECVFTAPCAAKEMSDDVTLEFYTKYNGKIVLENDLADDTVFTYSAMKYLDSLIASSDTMLSSSKEDKSLALALKNYGLCAQKYFNYKCENIEVPEIADPGIESLSGYACQKNGKLPDGVTYVGSSLILESRLSIRHYFMIDENVIDNLTLTLSNDNGVIGDEYSFAEKNGLYYFEISNISPADYEKAFSFSVDDGVNAWTVIYSPLSYVHAVYKNTDEELKKLTNALYYYGESAKP